MWGWCRGSEEKREKAGNGCRWLKTKTGPRGNAAEGGTRAGQVLKDADWWPSGGPGLRSLDGTGEFSGAAA